MPRAGKANFSICRLEASALLAALSCLALMAAEVSCWISKGGCWSSLLFEAWRRVDILEANGNNLEGDTGSERDKGATNPSTLASGVSRITASNEVLMVSIG